MATSFGYAEVIALSQTGVQAAEQAFFANSSCILQASWFDAGGDPYLPKLVNYQLVALESGTVLQPWKSLTSASVQLVTVTAAQNTMVNLSREQETHRAMFQVTDQNDTMFTAEVDFIVVSPFAFGGVLGFASAAVN